MSTELLTNYAHSVGLKVEDNGRIVSGSYEYGYVTATGYVNIFQDLDLDMEDISGIGFAEQLYTMTIYLTDGTEIPVKGLFIDQAEEYTIISEEENPAPRTYTPRTYPIIVSDFRDIFHELYPDCDSQLSYDELTERLMIDESMLTGGEPNLVALEDKIVNKYIDETQRRLKDHSFFGKTMTSDKVMTQGLLIEMNSHSTNRFREYVESIKWDGKKRLRTWFRDTFGATCNGALSPEDERLYLGDVAEAWFLGAIGRMYGSFRHEIVPIFLGIQGIGKGHALEYTAGRKEFFRSTTIDPTITGGVKDFLDSVRGGIIVEMEEATQFKGDANKMKSFITQEADQMRKPYMALDAVYPRHFILCASSNFDNIFTDSSGNRRFFPMYCNPKYQTRVFSTEDRSQGQYDVDQLWAEALYLFRHDGKAYIYGEAEKRAQVMQKYCTTDDSGTNIVGALLDDPMNGKNTVRKGALVNRQMILEMLGYTTKAQQMNKEAIAMVKSWEDNLSDGAWLKRDNVKIPGYPIGRGYERLLEPGEVAEPPGKFLMVPSSDSAELGLAIAISEMRRITRDWNLDIGDVIPMDAIESTPDLDVLLEKEFVINVGTEDHPEYRVGVFEE